MKIVIDVRPVFQQGFSAEVRKYIFDCLDMVTRDKLQAEFYFLTDRKKDEEELSGIRAHFILLKSGSSIFPGFLTGANSNLSKIIRAQNADLFFTVGAPSGRDFGIPECTWLFKNTSLDLKKPSHYQSVTSWLQTGSGNSKALLQKKDLSGNANVLVVPPAAEVPHAILTWTEKENVKVKYAGGKDYFITRSYFSEENLLMVLKAFSLFKKKQQSNMQLLITGMKGDANHAGFEKLETFKFRNDVHVYPSLEAEVYFQTTAAAYALIFPSDPGVCVGILNAMQAEVPVICVNDEMLILTVATSVLFAASGEQESFAGQMSNVFKDELLRADLISKGKIQAQKYTLQPSASSIWNGMMSAIAGDNRRNR